MTSTKNKDSAGINLGRHLPILSLCRAGRGSAPGMAYCLVPMPQSCPHCGTYENVWVCLHPDREAIIARTKTE